VIAYVSGTLVEKSPDAAVIDVNGLGYRLLITSSTYQALPPKKKDVKLHAYQHVREQDLTLFGFATKSEREVFEVMLGVSGVGPKLALAALSALNPAELRDSVVNGETNRLTDISGVGQKTAKRLIVNLGDRLDELDLGGDGTAPLSGGSEARQQARKDALKALEKMDLSRAEAERAIRKVLRDNAGVQDSGELVRLALNRQ
jgi:Holliday junction DNA helicase RuvA